MEETATIQQKTKPSKRRLVEDAIKLRLSDFGRGLLHPVWHQGAEKKGVVNIEGGKGSIKVSYEVKLDHDGRPELHLSFNTRPNDQYRMSGQVIDLAVEMATFGVRPYFQCKCGHKANVMYLASDCNHFRCRTCSNLIYESQLVNKHTLGGFKYSIHKYIKLADSREQIKREFYRGHYTKKMRTFFKRYQYFNGAVSEEMRALAMAQIISAKEKAG